MWNDVLSLLSVKLSCQCHITVNRIKVCISMYRIFLVVIFMFYPLKWGRWGPVPFWYTYIPFPLFYLSGPKLWLRNRCKSFCSPRFTHNNRFSGLWQRSIFSNYRTLSRVTCQFCWPSVSLNFAWLVKDPWTTWNPWSLGITAEFSSVLLRSDSELFSMRASELLSICNQLNWKDTKLYNISY